MENKQNYLQKVGIFSSLEQEELGIIALHSDFYTYKENEDIFPFGSYGDELYVVISGSVLISKPVSGQKEEVIATYIPGDSFGELDLLTDKPRNVRAKAEIDSRLLVFPNKKTSLPEIFKQYPRISAQLLHKFLIAVAVRIRSVNMLLKNNSPWVQELRNQLYTDKLTGLYNRTFLEEKYPNFLKGGKTSLLMVKPDNFKYINDNYGHEAGDQTLQIMARELKNLFAAEEIVIRFAGSEFAYICRNAGREAAYAKALEIQEILGKLDLTSVIGNDEFKMTISVGISLYPEHGKNACHLIELTHPLPLLGRYRGGGKIIFPEDVSE